MVATVAITTVMLRDDDIIAKLYILVTCLSLAR